MEVVDDNFVDVALYDSIVFSLYGLREPMATAASRWWQSWSIGATAAANSRVFHSTFFLQTEGFSTSKEKEHNIVLCNSGSLWLTLLVV